MDRPALSGRVAQVKHTYFTAAAIEGYSVFRSPAGEFTAVGRVVLSDPYLLTLRPLMFVAPFKAGAFRWPVETVTITDDRLVARLGAPVP